MSIPQKTEKELQALRLSVVRGCPFGAGRWQEATAKAFVLETMLHPGAQVSHGAYHSQARPHDSKILWQRRLSV